MNPTGIELCKAKLFQYISPVGDIDRVIAEGCESFMPKLKCGDTVAVGVGSRGIANIAAITKALVDYLIGHGMQAFIVPAMGSHGGATAEGQSGLLEGYGITAETMGVRIVSSMETEQIGTVEGEESFPVYFDKNALGADGVIVINRVKPHTDFHGEHESGIVKMLVIGMGKHKQALTMHRFGADGLAKLIPSAAEKVLEKVNIIGGIAIVEDGADNTSQIVCAAPEDFFRVDRMLLEHSRYIMAKLPFKKIDLLIIDEMGKNISGTGIDTNVIGRLRIKGQRDSYPDCDTIVVLDLTDESHGNATGIGLADVTTKYLYDKIDWKVTNENVITSGFLERGFLPIVAENDYEAIDIASRGNYDAESIRVVRIRNTLDLKEIYLSKPLMDELKQSGKGEQEEEYMPLSFGDGRLTAFD